jgi:hypothetical protein
MIFNDKQRTFLHKYMEDVNNKLNAAFWRAHPNHESHGGCKEMDVTYFDALMQTVHVQCVCGAMLDVDRDYF